MKGSFGATTCLVAFLGLLPYGCDSGTEKLCTPGQRTSCPCLGGADGVQDCLPDGSGWEECQCCQPSCAGKDCGDDGCGGSCGECESGERCADNACVCEFLQCGAGCCAQGESCWEGACCQPSCEIGTCPFLCSTESDCCPGEECREGLCRLRCTDGCNTSCDRARGLVCDPASSLCVPGAPPATCQDDCPCYSGELCSYGYCVDNPATCLSDAECAAGLICREGYCIPATCQTRDDCAGGAACLVCRAQACVPEPAVCAGDQDCCVGRHCNFSTCVDDVIACTYDADCLNPDLPRCLEGVCVQGCLSDLDCQVGETCVDNLCEDLNCSPQTCPIGYWCDETDGICKPGCDSNDDCTPPQTCAYQTHACGQTDCCGDACAAPAYCDTLSCACGEPCVRGDCSSGSCSAYPNTTCDAASNKCVACPANFTCDAATGQCVCAAGSCPTYSSCNDSTGMCEANQGTCDPACEAPEACSFYDVCVTPGSGQDGTPCFTDAECNASQGLLCDGSLFCIGCLIVDPAFVPEYVCREECSLLGGGCSGNYECKYRHAGLKGLCVPPPPP